MPFPVLVTVVFAGVSKTCNTFAALVQSGEQTCQPHDQSWVDPAVQPLRAANLSTITLPPRLMASERAKYSVDFIPSDA